MGKRMKNLFRRPVPLQDHEHAIAGDDIETKSTSSFRIENGIQRSENLSAAITVRVENGEAHVTTNDDKNVVIREGESRVFFLVRKTFLPFS